MGRGEGVLGRVGEAEGVVGEALRWEGEGRRWPSPWQGRSGWGGGGELRTRSTRCRTTRTPARSTRCRRRCSRTGRRKRTQVQECCIAGFQSL